MADDNDDEAGGEALGSVAGGAEDFRRGMVKKGCWTVVCEVKRRGVETVVGYIDEAGKFRLSAVCLAERCDE